MLAEQREAELDHDGEVRHRGLSHSEPGIEASICLERLMLAARGMLDHAIMPPPNRS
jgi:hypothetical protein